MGAARRPHRGASRPPSCPEPYVSAATMPTKAAMAMTSWIARLSLSRSGTLLSFAGGGSGLGGAQRRAPSR